MVLRIIIGGKRPPRRPYDEDDMQDLRDVIYDAVEKWGKDELAQIDTKRMALHALKLSILDLSQEGETDADIDAFQQDTVDECEHLIELARRRAERRAAMSEESD